MKSSPDPYAGHRFPREVIAHAVWLYHRFSLSFRDVEDLLAERGITVSYESVRQWRLKFGPSFAKSLRRRQARPGDTWFLDEVFVNINSERHYLWRAVDQDGDVLDILLQERRDKRAAKRFFLKLLKGLCYVPRVIVTDKLGSYRAAQTSSFPEREALTLFGPNPLLICALAYSRSRNSSYQFSTMCIERSGRSPPTSSITTKRSPVWSTS